MEDKEARQYIIKQATIEIDNARSWPTKVMIFFVAINYGLIASLTTLKKFYDPFSCIVKSCIAAVTIVLLTTLSGWAIYTQQKS